MREYLALALLVTAGACSDNDVINEPSGGPELLSARPVATTSTEPAGIYSLGITATKDARLIIPPVTGNTAVPLVVMLHGAGGDEVPVDVVAAAAAERNVAVLMPKSRQAPWDLALGGFGEDVTNIDRALQETFRRVRVDPAHIALAGFSDGASYALTLGIANGGLFSHIIAFAPGFLSPVDRHGRPNIFIAHGTQDVVTSPRNTEQNIVPFLRTLGYTVLFHSFSGSHVVRTSEATMALTWFVASGN